MRLCRNPGISIHKSRGMERILTLRVTGSMESRIMVSERGAPTAPCQSRKSRPSSKIVTRVFPFQGTGVTSGSGMAGVRSPVGADRPDPSSPEKTAWKGLSPVPVQDAVRSRTIECASTPSTRMVITKPAVSATAAHFARSGLDLRLRFGASQRKTALLYSFDHCKVRSMIRANDRSNLSAVFVQ